MDHSAILPNGKTFEFWEVPVTYKKEIHVNQNHPMADDANFDALWDEMSKTLDGYGFQDLVKFDTDKYQIELDAKNAVAAK